MLWSLTTEGVRLSDALSFESHAELRLSAPSQDAGSRPCDLEACSSAHDPLPQRRRSRRHCASLLRVRNVYSCFPAACCVLTPFVLASGESLLAGDSTGKVHLFALPDGGAENVPDSTPACMNGGHTTFGLLEQRRWCGACGGCFCGQWFVLLLFGASPRSC